MSRGADCRGTCFVSANVTHRANFFGSFRVWLSDRAVALGPVTCRTLLKWLLLHPGERFNVEQLCGVLWPDAPTRRNSLHVALHHLRTRLEPNLERGSRSTFVRSDGAGHYWFDAADRWCTDIDELNALIQSADTQADSTTAIHLYQAALDVYERTFLAEDLYNDAFADSRQAFETQYLNALQTLTGLLIRLDRFPEALQLATHHLEADPYSDEALLAAVRIYQASNDSAAAVALISRYTNRLHLELGIRPSDKVQRLADRLRRNISQGQTLLRG